VPVNEFGQPIGEPVAWSQRAGVAPVELIGRTVRLAPLTTAHTADLWDALVVNSPDSLWTYLFAGPFLESVEGQAGFAAYVASVAHNDTMTPFAVIVADQVLGHACLMRDDPAMGVIEVGNIALGSALQRSTAATEMIYLLAKHVFDTLGYRRFEWKCDSLNEPSRKAAGRFGFGCEGRFRQAVVYKGRNRDTDWFAMTDGDWAGGVRAEYERWLAPSNFAAGRQHTRLQVPTSRADRPKPETPSTET